MQRLMHEDVAAKVAELVDAPDLGSGASRRGGSSPFLRTSARSRFAPHIANVPGFLTKAMQTTIENLSALERRLTMAVPTADIEKQVDERLKRIARTVKMAGFRPGKVPMKLVAQQYGPQVRSEVIGDAVEKAFSDAVRGQNLRVAGYPKVEPRQGGDGGSLEFTATFEVYPEVALGDLSQATIERPVLEVTDAEVDKTLEVLRKQRVKFEAADRGAQTGDKVTIDFTGRIDGTEFPGGKGEDFAVVLGEGRMLPDFETGIAGMKAAETRTVPVKFPDDYHGKDVAGKTAASLP
jgi:trigger factor